MMLSKAIFAGGSFWEVQAVFETIPGVITSLVGYTGGQQDNPSYLDVSKGTSGHAEAVEVIFDPDIVSYEHLLDVFFSRHNPTSLNQQGPDIGNQYRSAVFYFNEEQKQAAYAKINQLSASRKYAHAIVTEVMPATKFWTAEEYHQNYFQKPGQTSCVYKYN